MVTHKIRMPLGAEVYGAVCGNPSGETLFGGKPMIPLRHAWKNVRCKLCLRRRPRKAGGR